MEDVFLSYPQDLRHQFQNLKNINTIPIALFLKNSIQNAKQIQRVPSEAFLMHATHECDLCDCEVGRHDC